MKLIERIIIIHYSLRIMIDTTGKSDVNIIN